MDQSERDDIQQLMMRLADGDRSAFDPLFELLWPVFLRFSERALHGSAEAQDVSQAALMKMFSRANEFEVERDALAWALGIVAYECRTARQKHVRRREDKLFDESKAHLADSPESQTIQRDLEDAAMCLLGELSEIDKSTLQIAISDERQAGATFRKRLQRALTRLRQSWKERHGAHE